MTNKDWVKFGVIMITYALLMIAYSVFMIVKYS